MIRLFIFCFVLLPVKHTVIRGKVVSVKDGDTIEILYRNEPVRIRLSAIDCPEKKHAFGRAAKDLTSKLCAGKIVKVVSHRKDRYGRIIGDVYLPDSTCLNKELLKRGMAWHYKKYSHDKEMAMLEVRARIGRVGLWKEGNPQAPWDFRKAKRKN